MQKLTTVFLSLLLSSCAYSAMNSTTSPIQFKGQPVGNINFVFRYESVANTNIITATTSDGEIYTGTAVNQASKSTIEGGTDLGYEKSFDHRHSHSAFSITDQGDITQTLSTTEWQAVLNSNRGNTMHCTLSARALGDNLTVGSVGTCLMSNNRQIPVSILTPPVKTNIIQ